VSIFFDPLPKGDGFYSTQKTRYVRQEKKPQLGLFFIS